MNKIVYLEPTRFVIEFQDILDEYYRINKHPDFQIASSKMCSDYRIFIKEYYENNFGIGILNCWEMTEKTFKIIDESKFNLFMLKYPDHIKKIVYE